MNQYFIAKDGKQEGVFPEDEIRAKLQSGEFPADALCWTEGMIDWQPLGTVFPGVGAVAVRTSAPGALAVNPYAPPQTEVGMAASGIRLETAGPGIRLGAAFLDGLLYLPGVVPMFIGIGMADGGRTAENTGWMVMGIGLLVILGIAIYNLVLLATRGQTLGKRIAGIRIVTYPDGENPGGVKTILLRGFVNGLIGAVPMIGGIYSLVDVLFIFSEDNRCLHDRIAGTYVVHGQPPGY